MSSPVAEIGLGNWALCAQLAAAMLDSMPTPEACRANGHDLERDLVLVDPEDAADPLCVVDRAEYIASTLRWGLYGPRGGSEVASWIADICDAAAPAPDVLRFLFCLGEGSFCPRTATWCATAKQWSFHRAHHVPGPVRLL